MANGRALAVWGMLGWAFGGVAVAQAPPVEEPPARPPEVRVTYGVRDGALVVRVPGGAEQRVELGCPGEQVIVHRRRAHVTCGAAGVAIVDLADPTAPRLLGRAPAPGEVRSLFVHGDQVWMEVAQVEARPVGAPVAGQPLAAVAGPEADRSPPDRSWRPPHGEVVEMRPGEVVVDLGSKHGLDIGGHVELYTIETVEMGGQEVSQERTAAIGVIETLSAERARVVLGFGERVDPQARARPTRREVTERFLAPPRQGGLFEIQAFVRPFLPMGEVGFGLLGDGSVTYRGQRHWFVRALVDPVGVGVGGSDTMGAFGGSVLAGYDHPMFSVGLGVGAMQVNDAASDIARRQLGLALAQSVRFGAIDGLHVEVTNSFVLVDTDVTSGSEPDELRWGSVRISSQIPVTNGGWLVFRGGGGRPGHRHFEGGLRWAVRGDGGHGSVFLMPTIGGVWLRRTIGMRDGVAQRAGPSVGLGVEWRP
jgi:hypothetical protein